MASNICIPKHLVEKLKASALKGEIDIRKLYSMTSSERRAFFTSYTDKELGKFINTEFEKAMVSRQQDALTKWAQSIFKPEARSKPEYQSMVDKIKSLEDIGVLSPENEEAFLEDLVSDTLGLTVTAEEIKEIESKAKKIDEAQVALGDNLGNPEFADQNIEFFKAKKDMDDYLQGKAPASNLRVGTGTIGRGMMLFSIKSPVLNVGSNIEVGITEALSRRLADMNIQTADNKLAVEYVKFVNKVYQETGYDLSRMMNLSDTGVSGGRVLGETVHAQGPGFIRKAGRVVEDVVFKQLMGAPDVIFGASHFADSVNLHAFELSENDPIKAREIMLDAMRLEPQTPEGEVVRAQGILDAQKATWTNTSWASQVSEGIRGIFNKVSGDVRLGDYLFPFIKTPANVIATGMDYAGMGVPKALIKTVRAVKTGELGSKEYIQSISRDLVRSGLGLVGALAIAMNLDDDDFVGAYDPARAQIEELRNSNYNAVRIGGKWISMDWFGPLTVPLTSILYAKKYGDTGAEKTFQYGKGVFSSVLNLPGVSDIYDYVRTSAYKKNQSLEEMGGELQNYLLSELYSRLTPSLVSDIAKASDPYDREGGQGFQGIKAKIPGLRQTLDVKTDIFGRPIKGENMFIDLFFGSRVGSDREDAAVRELFDVSDETGKGISFTNWDTTSSKTLEQFKEKQGAEKYEMAKIAYGEMLQKKIADTIKKPAYKNLSPDEKLKVINSLDSETMDEIFKKFGFKYKKPVTKKINL